MFRIALCDDDPEDLTRYRGRIQELVKDKIDQVEILTYQNAENLLFAVDDVKDLIDIMVLDIRMPGTDGIDLVRKLRKTGYRNDIIFLTNSEEDMLRAFDVGALNYVVKGKTSQERIDFIVGQAVRSAENKQSMKLILSGGGETRNISVNDVRYFQVIDHLIVVHYAETTFSFISSMSKIENRLENHGFIRVHRAYLVSCRYISSFNNKEVVLTTGECIPVSRSHYSEVKRILHEFEKA